MPSLTTGDAIPDEIYQHIFSYILTDHVDDIFSLSKAEKENKNYKLQFVNKTFLRNFKRYLKTKPLRLSIRKIGGKYNLTLKFVDALKRYEISVYELRIEFFLHKIMEALQYINFSSLRVLKLIKGYQFDFELLKDCKELAHFFITKEFLGRVRAEEQDKNLQTFLFLNRYTLESVYLPKLRNFPDDYFIRGLLSDIWRIDMRLCNKEFDFVSHPSELQSIGIYVEISDDYCIVRIHSICDDDDFDFDHINMDRLIE